MKKILNCDRSRRALSLAAVLLAASCPATEYVFNWDKAFPDSGDDIVYKDGNSVTRATFKFAKGHPDFDGKLPEQWLIDSLTLTPNVGDTVRFTGEPMTFFMTSVQSRVTSKADDTTVVFDNIVTNRTTYWIAQGAVQYRTWTGGNTFLSSTDWTLVATNVLLKDYEPVDSVQVKATGLRANWSYWYSCAVTMKVRQIVRFHDRLTFQLHSNLQTPGTDYRYAVAKVELKQGDDGIYARMLPTTYLIYTDADHVATYANDFDVDTVDIGDNLVEKGVFVNDATSSGVGINCLKLKRIRPYVTYRFRNSYYFSSVVCPFDRVCCDFLTPPQSKFTLQSNGEHSAIVFRDFSGSQTVSKSVGKGRIIYETTQAATTNSIVLTAVDNDNVMETNGQYIVRGSEDGGHMALTVTSKRTFGSSNNYFRVEHGGELILTNTMLDASQKFTLLASDGGLIRQSIATPFSSSSDARIVLDGGRFEFKTMNSGIGNLFCHFRNLELKNASRIDYVNTRGAGTSVNGALFCCQGENHQGQISVAGEYPSTNNAPLTLMSQEGVCGTNTFYVMSTGRSGNEPDFVQNGTIQRYYGSDPYALAFFRKSGRGTMLLNGNLESSNPVILAQGTLKFGKKASGSYTCAYGGTQAPIALEGGTLAAEDGASMAFGTIVRLTADSAIQVGENATFSFDAAASSADDWAEGKRLSITLPKTSCIRFGTSADALTARQLDAIRINGRRARLGKNGYLSQTGLILYFR